MTLNYSCDRSLPVYGYDYLSFESYNAMDSIKMSKRNTADCILEYHCFLTTQEISRQVGGAGSDECAHADYNLCGGKLEV